MSQTIDAFEITGLAGTATAQRLMTKVRTDDLQYVERLTLDEKTSGELVKALAAVEINPELDKDYQGLLSELVAFARDVSASTKRYVLVIG